MTHDVLIDIAVGVWSVACLWGLCRVACDVIDLTGALWRWARGKP